MNKYLRYYQDPAIGCPKLGLAIAFPAGVYRGFGIWWNRKEGGWFSPIIVAFWKSRIIFLMRIPKVK